MFKSIAQRLANARTNAALALTDFRIWNLESPFTPPFGYERKKARLKAKKTQLEARQKASAARTVPLLQPVRKYGIRRNLYWFH